MRKLLSIVIPTKDRYQYLKESVLVLEQMGMEDYEIIVQDNTYDNHEFLEFMEQRSLKNILYYHNKERLSVVQNSDMAIQHASGKYVCFIGDDDSVCPQIMDVVKYMQKNEIDACSVACARYNWPDLIAANKSLRAVMIYEGAKGEVEQIKGIEEMLKIMHSAVFSINVIPKVYQGIVSKEVLDKIYQISGSYSPGASPDIANAVAVCVSSQKHIYVNSPIIISGYSYKSGAGLGARKSHVNAIENVPWLDEGVKELWEEALPKVWTAETIWAESMIKGLRRMHKEQYIKEFNYVRFYAMFILRHRDCLSYFFKLNSGKKWIGVAYFPYLVIQKLIQRFICKKNTQHMQVALSDEPLQLEQAVDMISKYIDEYPLKFEEKVFNAN